MSVSHPQKRVNVLLADTLEEVHEFFRKANEERRREEFERRMAEIRARRWGYPVPRTRRRAC